MNATKENIMNRKSIYISIVVCFIIGVIGFFHYQNNQYNDQIKNNTTHLKEDIIKVLQQSQDYLDRDTVTISEIYYDGEISGVYEQAILEEMPEYQDCIMIYASFEVGEIPKENGEYINPFFPYSSYEDFGLNFVKNQAGEWIYVDGGLC